MAEGVGVYRHHPYYQRLWRLGGGGLGISYLHISRDMYDLEVVGLT